MALKLNNSVFFHLGRTGGYSVRSTLSKIGIVSEELGDFHATPDEIELAAELSTIAFIRHPLTWLRSLWYHKLVFGVDEYDPPVLSQISEVTPEVFLKYCIENYPHGIVYEYFKPFLRCNHIGRLEFLDSDLKEILVSCKEIDANFNLSVVRENESRHPVINEFQAPIDVLKEYLSTESHWCEKYGYKTIPNKLIGKSNYVSPLAGGWSNSLYRIEPSHSSKAIKLASNFRDVSPFLLGCAFRENLPVADIISWRLEQFDYDNYLYFSYHLREKKRNPLRSYDNFIIAEILRKKSMLGKSVLQLQCEDGFHSVSAERLGATEVISIDEHSQDFYSNFVIPFLGSNIIFNKSTSGEASLKWPEKFDILIENNLHKATSDLNGYISQLNQLLSKGGTLVLGVEILNDYNGLPLVLFPNENQSPTGGVAYMTYTYLHQLLSKHNFTDIFIVSQLNIGLDNPKEYLNLPFERIDKGSINRISNIDKLHVIALKKHC